MEEIKKNKRSIKEITEEMLKINQRKPTVDELVDLVKIINENSTTDDKVEIKKIAIKREKNDIEQTWI